MIGLLNPVRWHCCAQSCLGYFDGNCHSCLNADIGCLDCQCSCHIAHCTHNCLACCCLLQSYCFVLHNSNCCNCFHDTADYVHISCEIDIENFDESCRNSGGFESHPCLYCHVACLSWNEDGQYRNLKCLCCCRHLGWHYRSQRNRLVPEFPNFEELCACRGHLVQNTAMQPLILYLHFWFPFNHAYYFCFSFLLSLHQSTQSGWHPG